MFASHSYKRHLYIIIEVCSFVCMCVCIQWNFEPRLPVQQLHKNQAKTNRKHNIVWGAIMTRRGASVRVLWVLLRRMFFIKLDIKFDNGSCYLIVHVRACLGCRGGQGRGRLSVMVGVVGGILLSSCPLASLSCPPSLSPLSLSLSRWSGSPV